MLLAAAMPSEWLEPVTAVRSPTKEFTMAPHRPAAARSFNRAGPYVLSVVVVALPSACAPAAGEYRAHVPDMGAAPLVALPP